MKSVISLLATTGLLPGVRYLASPNCDDRPAGEPVRLVVVHAISLPPGEFGGEGVERLFMNALDPQAHPSYSDIYDLRVSAHFFIRRSGAIIQFVPVAKRAWHAGASCWRGRDRCNDFSLGIEIEGCDDKRYEPIQYIRLARLIRLLRKTFPIEEVVGHAGIAPGRKTDPGPCFDWPRLHQLLRRR
jgi:AmpD protein